MNEMLKTIAISDSPNSKHQVYFVLIYNRPIFFYVLGPQPPPPTEPYRPEEGKYFNIFHCLTRF